MPVDLNLVSGYTPPAGGAVLLELGEASTQYEATFAATLPNLASALQGEWIAPVSGLLEAVLPGLAAALQGDSIAGIAGAFAAEIPALVASLTGEGIAGVSGEVLATLPALEGSLTGSTRTFYRRPISFVTLSVSSR